MRVLESTHAHVIAWMNDTRVRSQSTLIIAESVAPVAAREWFMAGEKGFESANATNYYSAL